MRGVIDSAAVERGRVDERARQRGRVRAEFWEGVRDSAPACIGAIPFGMLVGVAALAAGFPPWLAMFSSFLVLAGASQLAAIQLIAVGAPLPVAVASAAIVNLRLAMYSAALAPHFRRLSPRTQWLAAFLLTDHAFAISLARFQRNPPLERPERYYFGVGSALWAVWTGSTVVGVAIGHRLPMDGPLGATGGFVLLALMVAALRSRPQVVAAVVAAAVAVLGAGIPYRLGLIVAAAAGIVAGMLAERFR
jgi:predicted branched-subunit amino acid permease